jgi:hypothetical protein
MKLINQIVSLAPTPLFFVGGVVSWVYGDSMCSAGWVVPEMTVMWFVMSLAHVGNWLVYFQRRRYIKLQQLPVKQQ